MSIEKRGNYKQPKGDIATILNKLSISFKVASGGTELCMDCPVPECPNPHNHLYLNKTTGLWICHRCLSTGSLLTFIKIVKKVSLTNARLIVFGEEVSWAPTIGELRKRIHEMPTLMQDIEKIYGLKAIIKPPPDCVRITTTKYPLYLNKRHIPFKLTRDLNVRICQSGRFSNRLIFPFSCNGNESFVAYRTRDFMKPKTLNPFGSENENLLYPFDFVQRNTGGKNILIVVEGIFDCLRLLLYNYRSVALLKSFLSEEQALLLNQCKYKRIVFILDGDVFPEKYERNVRNVSLITDKEIFFSPIFDQDKDPDQFTKSEVERHLQNMKPAGKEFALRARLKKCASKLGDN